MGSYPKISCIMPTGGEGRAIFVEQAIQLYNAQTYPNKELILIDSGEWPDRVGHVVPAQDDIVYVSLEAEAPITIGAKRNLACAYASGEILCHWDDDDFFSPERLMLMSEPMRKREADASLLKMRYVYRLEEDELYRCSDEVHAHLFAYGGRASTLMYFSYFHDDALCYENTSRGEDSAFVDRLKGEGARIALLDHPEAYVCLRHRWNSTSDFTYTAPHFTRVEDIPSTFSPYLTTIRENLIRHQKKGLFGTHSFQ